LWNIYSLVLSFFDLRERRRRRDLEAERFLFLEPLGRPALRRRGVLDAERRFLDAERRFLDAERRFLGDFASGLRLAERRFLEAERRFLEAERRFLEAERRFLEAERRFLEAERRFLGDLEAERFLFLEPLGRPALRRRGVLEAERRLAERFLEALEAERRLAERFLGDIFSTIALILLRTFLSLLETIYINPRKILFLN
jgi:bacterioferritin (cytochrome b1)